MVKTQKELKALTNEDWYKGVQLMVSGDILGPNEHRNIESYPILQDKKESLMDSIRTSKTTDEIESGLWWNQEAAIYDVPDVSKIKINAEGIVVGFPNTSDNGAGINEDFPLRRVSGHHRDAAARELGFKYHAVTVRVIDSDTRFKMMANENHASYNGHPLAQLETVKQALDILTDYANSYDDFEELNAEHPGAFKNQKAWKNALSQGIGSKTITAYLGKPWTETAVSSLKRVIDNIEAGMLTTKELETFSSISIIDRLVAIINDIYIKKDWPVAIKNDIKNKLMSVVNDPKRVITVKLLEDAKAAMLNQNVNPVGFIQNRTTQAFDMKGAVKSKLKSAMKKWDDENEGVPFGAEQAKEFASNGYVGYENIVAECTKELLAGDEEEVVSTDASTAAIDAIDEVDDVVGSLDLPTEESLKQLSEDIGITVDDPSETSPEKMIRDLVGASMDMSTLIERVNNIEIDLSTIEGSEALRKAMESLKVTVDDFIQINFS